MHLFFSLYILILKQNMVDNIVINWKYVGVQALYTALIIRGGYWCIAVCQNISLYEPEQSLSLSQDEGEQCWGVH